MERADPNQPRPVKTTRKRFPNKMKKKSVKFEYRIYDEHGNSRPCSKPEPITWSEWMKIKTDIVMKNLEINIKDEKES